MSAFLRRRAAAAPAPVFVVPGMGARGHLRPLDLDDRLLVTGTPRAASILLLVGELTPALVGPALRVHDELPHPRATVRRLVEGAPGGGLAADAFPGAVVAAGPDVASTAVAVWRDLVHGRRASEPGLLLDVDPNPWRDVGPFGQGGKGMTGGVPYGRPLATRGPDRDALELDRLPLRLGPLWRSLPPGLTLDVTLQGDVVQDVALGPNPYAHPAGGGQRPTPDVFGEATLRPVAVRDLETARARHHLGWAGETLRLAGLDAVGWRLMAAAESAATLPGASRLRRLATRLDRDAGLRLSLRGTGHLDGAGVPGLGPVTRASGLRDDARSDDPAYTDLGFEPVVQEEGDALARLRQRLLEAAQSVELAERAGDRQAAAGIVEGPRGALRPDEPAPASRLLDLVPPLLAGLEWGDAVAAVASLDLDLEEAAAGAPARR